MRKPTGLRCPKCGLLSPCAPCAWCFTPFLVLPSVREHRLNLKKISRIRVSDEEVLDAIFGGGEIK